MRIFSNTFDLATPVERRVFVSPNSIYAFGIKIVKNDVPVKDGTLKVYIDGTELTPMEASVAGFTLFQRTSATEPSQNKAVVEYTKDGLKQYFDLTLVTTDSTVFDIDQEGGAFELPIASDSVLGGIKVGQNLTIEADGTLNAEAVAVYTAGNGIGINDNVISLTATIPTKVSELQNDKNYAELSAVPTKTSDLINDSNFATVSQIPTKTSDITNDSGFITAANVPTKTSELENDSGFITAADVPEVPVATTTTAGKVIVGSGLRVDADGKIDVTGGSSEETDPVFQNWLSTENHIAIGLSATATGNRSGVAIGGGDPRYPNSGALATGNDTVAIGYATKATGNNSTAIGYIANASGNESIAIIGEALGNESIAIGHDARANIGIAIGAGAKNIRKNNSENQIAIGGYTEGNCTIAIGDGQLAEGTGSYAIGDRVIAIGHGANAAANNTIQLGQGNLNTANTFQIWDKPLLDRTTGDIPEARLSANALVKSTPTAVLSGTYSDGSEFSFDVYIKQ